MGIRGYNNERLVFLIIVTILTSITLFQIGIPERVVVAEAGPNYDVEYFDSAFYKYLSHSESYRVDSIWKTSTWEAYCEVFKYVGNSRYLAVYMEHLKGTSGAFIRETHITIKFYWSDNSYHIYDGQYKPPDGSFNDKMEQYSVSYSTGYLIFSVSLHYATLFYPYKVKVYHYNGYIKWDHGLTIYGLLKGKNIFTSAGKLRWGFIFNSERKSATLNIWVSIEVVAVYGYDTRSWTWKNIGTYNP